MLTKLNKKGVVNMAGLIPFSRRNSLFKTGFEDFYNILDNFFEDDWAQNLNFNRGSFKVDIQDNQNEYVVEAHLPGVNKDEISLELDEGRLIISVERQEKIDDQKKNYVHRESRYSSMSRTVYLRDSLDEDVKAKLDNGVLYISVPKQKVSKNSRIIEIE